MLAAKVEDMLNTVVRQIAFYSFERKLHLERRKGELTADQICESMDERAERKPRARDRARRRAMRPIGPIFRISSIRPSMSTPMRLAIVSSIRSMASIRGAREGFAERYLAMLSAGGTKHHSELLAPFGLDARDPAFWQIGLKMIETMIADLEGLEGKA